ncbi:MAG: MgtC/SapB family protein [Chloroflexota bacterium]
MAKKDRIAAEQEADADDGGLVFERFSLNGSATPGRPAHVQPDYGAWLVALGVVIATLLVMVLVALPNSRPTTGTELPDNEFTNIISSVQSLLTPSDHSLPVVLGKLTLAALLGTIVGYRQRIHVEEYIVQAHVIIAFTGALMMIIIGNEIVRAFGLVGAGSIIRYRTPVRDPRALASLFVTMGIGIAVGTGLFELALIGAVLIVLIQGIFGKIAGSLPATLYNPQRGYTLTLTTEDGAGTLDRVRQTFHDKDIRYRLLEFDARAKKTGLVKMTMVVEATASLSTEELTLLVFKDGVQSVSWEEE